MDVKKLLSGRLKWHAVAFFTIFIWAITFLTTKSLEETFTNLEILVFRYSLAYVVIWMICPKKPEWYGWKTEGLIILASICGTSFYQYMENLSVYYTTPASVSFITAMAPLFTAIFSKFILKTKLELKTVIGMIVSIIGVGFISFGDSKIIDTGLLGDMIILFVIWLWAIYTIIIKILSEKEIKGYLLTRKLFFYSLIEMLIPVILTFDVKKSDFSVNNIGGLVFLGIFASAICFFTWNLSVEKLGPVTTSKYLFVMPIITLVAQIVTGMSELSIIAVNGMCLVLAGLIFSQPDMELKRKKKD